MIRRLAVVGLLAATAVTGTAAPALAHGIGGRQDLPVPLEFFIVGAGLAIVISFVVVASRWTTPRLQDGPLDTPSRLQFLAVLPGVMRVVGVLGLALVLLGGIIEGTVSRNNIAPVIVFIYFWLVVPFLGVPFGDLWRYASPFRLIARWANGDREERPDLVADFGIWPAAVAFVSFTWLELVSPDSAFPRTLAIAAIVYLVYILVITAAAGLESGLTIGGGFERYSGFLGRIGPITIERDESGTRVVHRGWLRALPVMPEGKGVVAFVVAMIGTVTYDGMSAASWWRNAWGDLTRETWFETTALVGVVAAVGLAYLAASWSAARLAGTSSGMVVARRFAHTLVPIGFAYAFAHYFSLIVFEGQLMFRAASDPFGLGWNLFGTASWATVQFLPSIAIWYVQVATIVCGHIAGVVLSHDRALADFGSKSATSSQYAMLVLMVILTSIGLLILAG
jgi:hypothetical protein